MKSVTDRASLFLRQEGGIQAQPLLNNFRVLCYYSINKIVPSVQEVEPQLPLALLVEFTSAVTVKAPPCEH